MVIVSGPFETEVKCKATLQKQETLRQRGYDVKIMWECIWDLEVKTNLELQRFVDMLEIVHPFQLRNVFLGGCANSFKLHHAAEKIE